jgi:hypothetical protein
MRTENRSAISEVKFMVHLKIPTTKVRQLTREKNLFQKFLALDLAFNGFQFSSDLYTTSVDKRITNDRKYVVKTEPFST